MSETLTKDAPWHFRGPSDEWVHREVYLGNEYKVPDDMAGTVVVDVGANCGTFSRLCAERGARVLAFEPHDGNADHLELNCAGVRRSVWLCRCAVGDVRRTANLCIRDDLGHNICQQGAGLDVRVESMDGALALARALFHTETIDLVKIDAEGAEYLIVPNTDFAGVKALAIEFHDNYVPEARRKAEECRRRLAGLGFRELCWDVSCPETGWYRIYRGVRG